MVRLKNGVSKLLLPAAATAGLLLAGVGNAGAQPVIEFSFDGAGLAPISADSGSQTVGSYTITGLSATETQGPAGSVLDLSFASLTTLAIGQTLILKASDTGFTYDPAAALLNSAASTSVNESAGSSGGDTIALLAGSDTGNALYAFPIATSPTPDNYTSPGPASGGTYTPSFTTGQTLNLSINSTGYSLSTSISLAIVGSVGFASPFDSFGATSSSAFITAAAGPALSIPATGWLSLAGGTAMFGGLAIRRRMKS